MSFATQMSSAVKHFHDFQFVHRDVKLENMLLMRQGVSSIHVKLGDFGYARQATLLEGCSTICGTLDYMAPEVCLLRHRIGCCGQQADVWSFRISLYMWITAEHNFLEGDLWVQIMRGDIVWSFVLENGWRSILKDILVVSAKDRVAIDEVVKKVDEYVSDLHVH